MAIDVDGSVFDCGICRHMDSKYNRSFSSRNTFGCTDKIYSRHHFRLHGVQSDLQAGMILRCVHFEIIYRAQIVRHFM
jgi:hypothetical protein